MNDNLRAAAEMALEELTQIKYGLERNRVWGGMEWSYVPIHPTQYLPLRDKLEAQIAALRQALAEPPSKPWVSLTDDEKWAIFTSKDWTGKPLSLIDAVLTAYEEKNHD